MLKRLLVMILTASCCIASAQDLPSLLAAIKANDSKAITASIRDKANLTQRDTGGDGPLMYAALYCPPPVMKSLLDAGANPDTPNDLGETALMWSVPDITKTKMLIAAGADVNLLTKERNNALLIACVGHNQQEIIRILLNAGADAAHRNKSGTTCLMRLAQYGDTTSANLLLNAGDNVNAKGNDSTTALFVAVRSVNAPMVHWLIDHGIDVSITDRFNAPALFYAASSNNEAMVSLLLDKTTDVNIADIDGATALMWCVYSEYDNPRMVQLFINRKADVRFRNKSGETPLSWARKKGNTKTVALLVANGAE